MSRFRWRCFALIILKCHLSAAKDITGEAIQGLFGLQFLCHTFSNIRQGSLLAGWGEFKFQISGGAANKLSQIERQTGHRKHSVWFPLCVICPSVRILLPFAIWRYFAFTWQFDKPLSSDSRAKVSDAVSLKCNETFRSIAHKNVCYKILNTPIRTRHQWVCIGKCVFSYLCVYLQ